MKTISNIDVLISVRDLFIDKLKEMGISISVYELVFPADKKERPDEFFLIKPIFQRDRGNVDIPGTIEVCAYVKNLNKGNDQSQPNLSRLKYLTDIAVSILDDAIKNATAITSIDIPAPISHPEIKSFYNSIVCGTFNVKSIN